jgi:uncharacterized protein (DUF1501 family)
MVVPFGDPAYYAARRSIAIASPARGCALDLDGHFGLHPALRPLMELYGRRELAIVHATGSPSPTRSHSRRRTSWRPPRPTGARRTGG